MTSVRLILSLAGNNIANSRHNLLAPERQQTTVEVQRFAMSWFVQRIPIEFRSSEGAHTAWIRNPHLCLGGAKLLKARELAPAPLSDFRSQIRAKIAKEKKGCSSAEL